MQYSLETALLFNLDPITTRVMCNIYWFSVTIDVQVIRVVSWNRYTCGAYRFAIFLILYRNGGIAPFWNKILWLLAWNKKIPWLFPDFWHKIKFPDFSLTIIFFPVFPVFQTLWKPCISYNYFCFRLYFIINPGKCLLVICLPERDVLCWISFTGNNSESLSLLASSNSNPDPESESYSKSPPTTAIISSSSSTVAGSTNTLATVTWFNKHLNNSNLVQHTP